MDLKTYTKALKACITASPPDLGNEDSVLGMLYEAYSESSAMYDDEIKAGFHALYEAMHGMPCGRWIRSSIQSVLCVEIIRSLVLLKEYE